MRIGVDATCWSLRRGFGRHARCLLTAVREVDTSNEYVFFTDSDADVRDLSLLGTCRLVRTAVPTIAAASAGNRRSLADLLAIARAMSDSSLDVLLFPTTYSYVPVLTRARKLMLFHDVIAERFPSLTLDSRRSRWIWRMKMALARHQADLLIGLDYDLIVHRQDRNVFVCQ